MRSGRSMCGVIQLTLFLALASSVHGQRPIARPGAPTPGQEAEVLELLEVSLQSLAEDAHRDRRIGGYVLLGLGGAAAVGGAVTLAASDEDALGVALLGGGAALAGLSLLPFKLSSESERIYAEFDGMPAGSDAQRRQRFLYGDSRFEELAEDKRRGRLVSGVLQIAAGVASLVALREEPDEYRFLSGSIVSGVMALALESDEERRYKAYARARDAVFRRRGDGGPN